MITIKITLVCPGPDRHQADADVFIDPTLSPGARQAELAMLQQIQPHLEAGLVALAASYGGIVLKGEDQGTSIIKARREALAAAADQAEAWP